VRPCGAAHDRARPVHLRTPRRCSGVRGLALHRLEHRDDRPPLRPPGPRQPRARSRATGRACARAGGGRCVDVVPKPRKRGQQQRFEALSQKDSPACGRSVDAAARSRRPCRQRKELISRNFEKPSDGLEPSTPSLPCAPKRLPWVAIGCRSAYLSRFRRPPICDRLPPVAPARLHKRSIPLLRSMMGKGIPRARMGVAGVDHLLCREGVIRTQASWDGAPRR
jgi:hypothetical protein